MSERKSLRVFAGGPPDCGKSRLLFHEYVSKTPRVISIDIYGETHELNADAIRTFGLEELREALKRCASFRQWHVAAFLSENEIAPFFAMMFPEKQNGDTLSYSRAVGGVAIECGEGSYLCPNGRTSPEVRRAFLGGRHELVSMYVAVQSPALVDRRATQTAERLISFQTHEATDLDYWQKKLSPAIAEIIAELPQYHSILYLPASGRVYVRDGSYQSYRVLDARGREIASRRPQLVRQS